MAQPVRVNNIIEDNQPEPHNIVGRDLLFSIHRDPLNPLKLVGLAQVTRDRAGQDALRSRLQGCGSPSPSRSIRIQPGRAHVPSHFQVPLAAGALVQAPVFQGPLSSWPWRRDKDSRLWSYATNFAGSYDLVDSEQARVIDPLKAALENQVPGPSYTRSASSHTISIVDTAPTWELRTSPFHWGGQRRSHGGTMMRVFVGMCNFVLQSKSSNTMRLFDQHIHDVISIKI